MKKLFAIALAVAMFASMATAVSAAENSKTTTLTTEVPAASYTLNIPADQDISFGATKTSIGNVTVTNAKNFAVGKNLVVNLTYEAFKSQNVTTTIPFTVSMVSGNSRPFGLPSGSKVTFYGKADTTVEETAKETFTFATTNASGTTSTHEDVDYADEFRVYINSSDWGKALAGEYTATITFTAEVVVE